MARARPHEQPGWGRKMDGNVERVKLFSRQVGAERFCVNVMMIEGMGENVLAKEFFGFVNIHQDPVGGPQVPLLGHGMRWRSQIGHV